MASIHKTEKSPYYYCAFYLPNGRRSFRSTGTSSRRKALGICLKFEEASRVAKEGRLTDTRARTTIADIFHIANEEKLPSSTLEEYLSSWLKKKELEVADASYSEYEHVVSELKTFMGSKIKKPMDAITPRDIDGFRAHVAERVSPVSVNKYLKILRGVWTMALKEGIARENIFDRVEFVNDDESKKMRRAFRLDELKRILTACGDSEWRGIVLCGLYTGQRLGDCVSIRWQNIDLTEEEIHIRTRKTGRQMSLPIVKPLLKYIMAHAGDNPDAPLFPKAYASYEQSRSTISRQFGELLARAGLAEVKDHKTKQEGRSARRKTGNLSFHCLRHTATSLLKNAGVSDVVAREIIGHDSEAISRVYTHIEKPTLKKALNKMPDVTNTMTNARN